MRRVPSGSGAALRPGRPAPGRDRPGAERDAGLVDRTEHPPAALPGRGRTGQPGRGRPGSAAHHRRRPRRRRRQPAPAALPRPVGPRPAGVHRARAPPGSGGGCPGGDAAEPHRPVRRGRAQARPARRPRYRGAHPPLRRRTRGRAGQAGHDAEPGRPVPGDRARPPRRGRVPGRPARTLPGKAPPATGPDWAPALQASMFARLRPATREVLQRVAMAGSSFDTDEFVALSGLAEEEAFGHLDDALAARIVEPTSAGYRFRHCLIRDALTGDVPGAPAPPGPPRHRAARLIELRASPARIGHHFLAARAPGADAVPYLLRAAETESAAGAYRDALALVDAIRPHAMRPMPDQGARRCAPTCSPRSVTRWPRARPLPGSARRGRSRGVRGGCAPGWRTARSWRAISPRRRPPWTASTPTAAPTMPTSSSRGASTRSSPPTSTPPGPRSSRRSG